MKAEEEARQEKPREAARLAALAEAAKKGVVPTRGAPVKLAARWAELASDGDSETESSETCVAHPHCLAHKYGWRFSPAEAKGRRQPQQMRPRRRP